MRATGTIMSEEDLYALWSERAEPGVSFLCLGGQRVQVLSGGRRNSGPGPDFSDAVLLIDGWLRVGPVEMHLREEEWFAHGHGSDPAYDRVILHLLRDPPATLRLPIATVMAARLPGAGGGGIEQGEKRSGEITISPALLVECAWSRFLRRVVLISRRDRDLPTPAIIRRAFLTGLYDCLGYSTNRDPMRRLATLMIADEPALAGASFETVATILFGHAGIDRESAARVGARFLSGEALARILAGGEGSGLRWRPASRPAGAPERRLWGAARLTFDLYANDLLRPLFALLTGSPEPAAALAQSLTVRLGGESLVGGDRGMEIVINAFLPVAAAAGIATGRNDILEAACRAYRTAPPAATNRIVRRIEERYLGGRTLRGGFWQQGAIEFHQRYLSPDRSPLSFVAESRGVPYMPPV